MISIILPCNNDEMEVRDTLKHLVTTMPAKDTEIIVVNDGSTWPCNKPKKFDFSDLLIGNLIVHNNYPRKGVGYAIDRGVERSNGENIVILGADTKPLAGWYEKVMEAVKSNPNTLGCAVSIGDKHKHYGANLLVQMGFSDLPKSKQVPANANVTALFQAKWREKQDSQEPYEIPCVLGAFYWTSKEYYQRIGGWDTQAGNRWRGHRYWGNLEPHISLKSWLTGGGCTLYPDIEARHLYGRITRENKFVKRSHNPEARFWNQLWIAETMVMDARLRERLINYLHPELNLGVAKRNIKRHYENILESRKRNKERFTRDFTWFLDRFKIELK